MMSYREFADNLLVAAYLATNEGWPDLTAGDLLDRFDLTPRTGWVEAALDEFAVRGWAENDPTLGDERQLAILLRGRGLRAAEDLMERGVLPDRRASLPSNITEPPHNEAAQRVPASDRIVFLDDNDPKVAEIRSELTNLRQKIRSGNDLGSMSETQAHAAGLEVQELQRAFAQPSARAAWLMSIASSTLQWIGKEAAGALVGAVALAVLGLIANYLGLL